MEVTISGMFGSGRTYFADSPVEINIDGLPWPESSPFTIVRMEVIYLERDASSNVTRRTVGEFRADTGGQTKVSFDISSALKSIWSDYDFEDEAGKATLATDIAATGSYTNGVRIYRDYSLILYMEYLSSDGQFTTISSREISGGQCAVGHMTEWERSLVTNIRDADVSHLQNKNPRNGDASTKPTSSPERVGSGSITSWVDFDGDGVKSVFYPKGTTPGDDSYSQHAPLVLRDSQPYVDFLFLNRRGAIETCSGMTKEAMGISTDTKQYGRTEGPSFIPTRSLMAIGSDGRRSWQMSSGYVTREWAEWWTMEFLGGKRKLWWMLWQGPGQSSPKYVPVIVKPAKSDTSIYDRSKQQMPHVDFTVTLALEG